jgi:hypothetical protein
MRAAKDGTSAAESSSELLLSISCNYVRAVERLPLVDLLDIVEADSVRQEMAQD